MELLKQKDEAAIAAKLAADGEGFADNAKNASVSIEERIAAQEGLLKELAESIAKPPAIPPRAM